MEGGGGPGRGGVGSRQAVLGVGWSEGREEKEKEGEQTMAMEAVAWRRTSSTPLRSGCTISKVRVVLGEPVTLPVEMLRLAIFPATGQHSICPQPPRRTLPHDRLHTLAPAPLLTRSACTTGSQRTIPQVYIQTGLWYQGGLKDKAVACGNGGAIMDQWRPQLPRVRLVHGPALRKACPSRRGRRLLVLRSGLHCHMDRGGGCRARGEPTFPIRQW